MTALFRNFSDEPFTGYWNGRPYNFKAGEEKFLPDYLAAHFAKHLTNRELLKKGKDFENYTSPKRPQDVPQFMELFNKACIFQQQAKNQDDTQAEVDLLNKKENEPSMNVAEQNGPEKDPQIINSPDDDEQNFEE